MAKQILFCFQQQTVPPAHHFQKPEITLPETNIAPENGY